MPRGVAEASMLKIDKKVMQGFSAHNKLVENFRSIKETMTDFSHTHLKLESYNNDMKIAVKRHEFTAVQDKMKHFCS